MLVGRLRLGHRAFVAITAVCTNREGHALAAAIGIAKVEQLLSARRIRATRAAMSPDGDSAQPFVTCPWFASHLAVCNLGHMVSFPVANWLPIEIVWLPIRCQLRSAFFESNRAILDEKLAASQ